MSEKDMSEEDTRAALVEREHAVELARQIVKHGGLHQHESIIVVPAGAKKYRVLEGNRRTCACQILLNPSLLPKAMRGRLGDVPASIKKRLRTLRVVVAPSEIEAAPLIAQLHTKNSKSPWSAAAKAFHIGRLADLGESPQKIANALGLELGNVKRTVLGHRLLAIARSGPGLTAEESFLLRDPRLKTNAFTRFFSLKEASTAIPLKINEKGGLEHENFSTADANAVIQAISREFLLPMSTGGAPRFDTRSQPGTVLAHVVASTPALARLLPTNASKISPARTSPKTSGRHHSTASSSMANAAPAKQTQSRIVFFSGLQAPADGGQPIANLIYEITQINHKRLPAASTFLMRGLVEASLLYALQRTKKRQAFQASLGMGRYGLQDLIQFCIDHRNEIWVDPHHVDATLNFWRKSHKYVADQTIHALISGSTASAEQAATQIRPLVEGILNGTFLKT